MPITANATHRGRDTDADVVGLCMDSYIIAPLYRTPWPMRYGYPAFRNESATYTPTPERIRQTISSTARLAVLSFHQSNTDVVSKPNASPIGLQPDRPAVCRTLLYLQLQPTSSEDLEDLGASPTRSNDE